METWHIDIEDFLELRKNTGDERRRTHDMNTANWIPDLFMKRVAEEAEWTLLSPDDASDLHELTGKAFEARYTDYEAKRRVAMLNCSVKFQPCNYGAKCWACCLKPDIRGLPLKTRAMCVTPINTWVVHSVTCVA